MPLFFGLQYRLSWHGSQEQSQGIIKRFPALGGEGTPGYCLWWLITNHLSLKSPSAELFFGLYTRALITTTTAIDFFSLFYFVKSYWSGWCWCRPSRARWPIPASCPSGTMTAPAPARPPARTVRSSCSKCHGMPSFGCILLFVCFTSKHGTILISWACAILLPAGYLQGPIPEGQQHPCKFPLVSSKCQTYVSVLYTATVH
jgi:hypothetical protein